MVHKVIAVYNVFTLKWSIRFKVTTCVSSICDHFIVFLKTHDNEEQASLLNTLIYSYSIVNYSWPNKYGNMSLNPRYTGSLYWC